MSTGFIPLKWPARGEIRFEGVTLRYDHSNEIAIHNLTLHIKPGQKVGIFLLYLLFSLSFFDIYGSNQCIGWYLWPYWKW